MASLNKKKNINSEFKKKKEKKLNVMRYFD